MAKVKCNSCGIEIIGPKKIQEFDPIEPTTTHVFCSESCREEWLATLKIKN